MSELAMEQSQPDPLETAQGFWQQWITDPNFGRGITDPMSHVQGSLETQYRIHPQVAAEVTRQAFETTLLFEQDRQRAAQKEV